MPELHVYLYKLAVMFRVPEGRVKLKNLVKAIYGDQFSPFPPKFYRETSRNMMIPYLPV